MPPFETMDRPQKMTYWPMIGNDRLGQFVVGSPVQIDVQYDDDVRKILDAKGNTIATTATIFTNRILEIGSIVRYGTLSDWVGTGSGLTPKDLLEVKSGGPTFDIKGRNKTYFYGLVRYNDVLPTIGFE